LVHCIKIDLKIITSNLTSGVSESFGLINVRADKYLWDKKAAIYLQVENLMNIQYADFFRGEDAWQVVDGRNTDRSRA